MDTVAVTKRLHPGTIIIRFLKETPRQILAVPALVAVISARGYGYFVPSLIGLLALGIIFQALRWWRFTYQVLPNELYIESGVLNRTKRSIPWDRVQDVDIERDLFARVFGWAKVKLETGGAGKDEGKLDSISLSDAEALRDLVRTRRSGASQNNRAAVDAPAQRVAFHMPLNRVLLAGLFNFSVLWLAIVAGAFQLVQDWLPYNMDDIGNWAEANFDRIPDFFNLQSIPIAITAFLILGFLSGLIQMVLTNYGFRLSLEGNGLRRQRGLFTRSDIVIPKERIQLATITRRWFGWSLPGYGHVGVQVIGSLGTGGNGAQELAILASPQEVSIMLKLAGEYSEPDAEAMQSTSSIHPLFATTGGVLLLVGIMFGVGWFYPGVLALLWFVPAVAFYIWRSSSKHGWLVKNSTLYVRNGWFNQKLSILKLGNIQSISLEIWPLQRALNLATIAVDSAGGPTYGLRIKNLAKDRALHTMAVLRGLT